MSTIAPVNNISPLRTQLNTIFKALENPESQVLFSLSEDALAKVSGAEEVIFNRFLSQNFTKNSVNTDESNFIIEKANLKENLLNTFNKNVFEILTTCCSTEIFEQFIKNCGYVPDSKENDVSPRNPDTGKIRIGKMHFVKVGTKFVSSEEGKVEIAVHTNRICSEFFQSELYPSQFKPDTPVYVHRCLRYVSQIIFLRMSDAEKLTFIKDYGIPFLPKSENTDELPNTTHSSKWAFTIYNDGKYEMFMNRAGYDEIRLLATTHSAWKLRSGLFTDPNYYWTRNNYNHSESIQFLNSNFRNKGHVELATILTVHRRLMTDRHAMQTILNDIGYSL